MKRPTIVAIRKELKELLPPVEGKLHATAHVAVSWATDLWEDSEDDEMAPLRLSYEALHIVHKQALLSWMKTRGLRVWSHDITGSRWHWRHVLTLVPDHDEFVPSPTARHCQDRLP